MMIDRILFSAATSDRAHLLLDAMTACCWTGLSQFDLTRSDALSQVRADDPTVVVIDLGIPDRAVRDNAFRIARTGRWPVVIFTDLSDDDTTDAAITAGVAAYVVNGLEPGRLRDVVQTAVTRFRQMERLRRERDEAVSAFNADVMPHRSLSQSLWKGRLARRACSSTGRGGTAPPRSRPTACTTVCRPRIRLRDPCPPSGRAPTPPGFGTSRTRRC